MSWNINQGVGISNMYTRYNGKVMSGAALLRTWSGSLSGCFTAGLVSLFFPSRSPRKLFSAFFFTHFYFIFFYFSFYSARHVSLNVPLNKQSKGVKTPCQIPAEPSIRTSNSGVSFFSKGYWQGSLRKLHYFISDYLKYQLLAQMVKIYIRRQI